MIIIRFVLTIVALFVFACHDEPGVTKNDCDARPIRTGVASSLREIALILRQELIDREPPVEVEMIFGASSVHARQLALGAPIDILVSADAEIVEDLIERGLLNPDAAQEIARGQLALVARADWPGRNPGLESLRSPELRRLAIPSASVPLGRYARSWLEGNRLLEGLEGKLVTTEHARATLSAVEAGHVDLAIVYASDARLARRASVLARLEISEYPPIRYVAARVASASDCPSIDLALAAWTEPQMIRRLADIGFLPPGSSGTF